MVVNFSDYGQVNVLAILSVIISNIGVGLS